MRGSSLVSDPSSSEDAFVQARPLLEAQALLVASDFDGTISHFVSDPWSAAIVSVAQRALRRLASRPHVHVALISGRTVEDLANRARVGGISYRGDHGAQRAEASRGFRPWALHVSHESVDQAVADMADRLKVSVPRAIPDPWLVLEDKGAALTFHFRTAPDVDAVRGQILAIVDAIDADQLLHRSVSRRAVELRPATASTKGEVLWRLIEERHADAVLMLGDDRNDALAFDALREARDTGRIRGLAVAVAGHADFDTVAPRADLVLAGPVQAARFLALLARATVRHA